jgi:hypothetical protein
VSATINPDYLLRKSTCIEPASQDGELQTMGRRANNTSSQSEIARLLTAILPHRST